ncbi:hypothetical protein JL722_10716 [Aureococcus anophagefferens]|nr:hypothetical protein JL722_10716 [Aureococcus anophagefferens]
MDAASEANLVWLKNPFPLTDGEFYKKRLGGTCGRPEYVPCRVVARNGGELTLETVDEPKMTIAKREADVLPSNSRLRSGSRRNLSELARATHCNAPSVVSAAHGRHVAGEYWTYAGRRDGPLVFLNPNGPGAPRSESNFGLLQMQRRSGPRWRAGRRRRRRSPAAILALGDVEFGGGDEAKYRETAASKTRAADAAELLGVDGGVLRDAFLCRVLDVASGASSAGVGKRVPARPSDAEAARDGLIKALYGRLVTWVVKRASGECREAARAPSDVYVLDACGFDDAAKGAGGRNFFDELLHNAAAERHHAYYAETTFSDELKLYDDEGLDVSTTKFPAVQTNADLGGLSRGTGRPLATHVLCTRAAPQRLFDKDPELARDFFEPSYVGKQLFDRFAVPEFATLTKIGLRWRMPHDRFYANGGRGAASSGSGCSARLAATVLAGMGRGAAGRGDARRRRVAAMVVAERFALRCVREREFLTLAEHFGDADAVAHCKCSNTNLSSPTANEYAVDDTKGDPDAPVDACRSATIRKGEQRGAGRHLGHHALEFALRRPLPNRAAKLAAQRFASRAELCLGIDGGRSPGRDAELRSPAWRAAHDVPSPTLVRGLDAHRKRFAWKVACGLEFSVVVTRVGTRHDLFAWGNNDKGQLGLGDGARRWAPEMLTRKAVATPKANASATELAKKFLRRARRRVRQPPRARARGVGRRLGLRPQRRRPARRRGPRGPERVRVVRAGSLVPVTQIVAGWRHSAALTARHELYAWGAATCVASSPGEVADASRAREEARRRGGGEEREAIDDAFEASGARRDWTAFSVASPRLVPFPGRAWRVPTALCAASSSALSATIVRYAAIGADAGALSYAKFVPHELEPARVAPGLPKTCDGDGRAEKLDAYDEVLRRVPDRGWARAVDVVADALRRENETEEVEDGDGGFGDVNWKPATPEQEASKVAAAKRREREEGFTAAERHVRAVFGIGAEASDLERLLRDLEHEADTCDAVAADTVGDETTLRTFDDGDLEDLLPSDDDDDDDDDAHSVHVSELTLKSDDLDARAAVLKTAPDSPHRDDEEARLRAAPPAPDVDDSNLTEAARPTASLSPRALGGRGAATPPPGGSAVDPLDTPPHPDRGAHAALAGKDPALAALLHSMTASLNFAEKAHDRGGHPRLVLARDTKALQSALARGGDFRAP